MKYVVPLALLVACKTDPSPASPGVAQDASAPSVVSNSAPVPVPAPSASAILLTDSGVASSPRYSTVTNLEMTPYCLPVPSSYVEPDRSERWERGRNVFVNKSKRSKIDYAGWCSDKPLKDLYEGDVERTRKAGGGKIALNVFHPDNYVLSWSEGQRIHYGKVWVAKGDAGCFIRATFEYEESERSLFDGIVSKVTHSDPSCPP